MHDFRRSAVLYRILGNGDLFDRIIARDLKHQVLQRIFHNGTQAAGAGLAGNGLFRNGVKRFGCELQIDLIKIKELLILADKAVFRLCEDAHKCGFVEVAQRGDDRQTTDKLRDEAELDEVVRGNFFHPLRVIKLVFALDDRVKAQRLRFGAALNDAFKAVERTAADEEDVRGIDVDDLLLRVLSAALWRDAGNGTLQNF